ncbi:hypothetical protein PT2222_120257 [Paraburkholderia tropica]
MTLSKVLVELKLLTFKKLLNLKCL